MFNFNKSALGNLVTTYASGGALTMTMLRLYILRATKRIMKH